MTKTKSSKTAKPTNGLSTTSKNLSASRKARRQSGRVARHADIDKPTSEAKAKRQEVGETAASGLTEPLRNPDKATLETADVPAAAKVAASDQPRNSKQEAVIALLNGPNGTTIDAIMETTGWQQHSVRGFFSGVVRKKLRLNLVSEKTEGGRIYRIAAMRAAGKARRKAA